jgi:hypothetical protein
MPQAQTLAEHPALAIPVNRARELHLVIGMVVEGRSLTGLGREPAVGYALAGAKPVRDRIDRCRTGKGPGSARAGPAATKALTGRP